MTEKMDSRFRGNDDIRNRGNDIVEAGMTEKSAGMTEGRRDCRAPQAVLAMTIGEHFTPTLILPPQGGGDIRIRNDPV